MGGKLDPGEPCSMLFTVLFTVGPNVTKEVFGIVSAKVISNELIEKRRLSYGKISTRMKNEFSGHLK